MGGITFYLFIVLTFTGVLLMFYYHPTKLDAFATFFISNRRAVWKLPAQHASAGRALDVITTWLHMVSRRADRFVQETA
jgi:quinol-cytochrome oxidoreductase complex cytochrome b subunit